MQTAHTKQRVHAAVGFVSVFVLAVAPFVGACAERPPPESRSGGTTEIEECEPARQAANEMATIAGAAAEKSSEAETVRNWIRQRKPHAIPPEIAGLNANAKVAVCAFTGSGFVTPRPPGAPDPDTVTFLVTPNGKAVLYAVGLRENMSPLTP